MTDKYLNKLAEHVADKIGSPTSIIIHQILFLINLSLMFWMDAELVLLILTTWVSLEAINLALLTQLVVTNDKKMFSSKHPHDYDPR